MVRISVPSTVFLLVLVLAGAWWHTQLGASLPTPCGDEVVFYYPSQAMGLHGSLHAPQLNPDRPLHWMPPGYMATLGAWMNVFGFGLESGRWLSFLLAACALSGWWNLWRRLKLPNAGLVLVAWAFVSYHWLVMSNMVRMEGLLLCLFFLALQLLWSGYTLGGAGLIALAFTVHPNALYLSLALPFLVVLAPRHSFHGWRNLLPPSLALTLSGFYAFYVFQNWDDFAHDWAWQLSTRSPDGLRILLLRADQAVFIALVAFLGWRAWQRRDKAVGFALVMALAFWAMRILGQGWSYGVFNVIALVTVLGCFLKFVEESVLPRYFHHGPARKALPYVMAFGLGVCLVVGKIFNVPFRWEGYEWMGMHMQNPAHPAFTDEDRQAVRAKLWASLPPGKTHKVYFVPEGEGIQVAPYDTGRVLDVLPLFGENMPDYFVIHRKGDFFVTETIHEIEEILEPGQTLPPPFHVRADNEWYLLPLKPGKYPPFILQKGDKRLPKGRK